MPSTELRMLMHAVLDGEASPAQAAELEQLLAANPAAREEFEDLERLFAELDELPWHAGRPVPEGLAASVQAALPGIARPRDQDDESVQLSASGRVIPASSGDIYMRADGPAAQQHQPAMPVRRPPMTQPHPPYSAKRKAILGAGVAFVAVVIVWQFGFESTPNPEDVAGTVVPAQRYRAAQTGAADIKLGDQSLAQLMQNDAFVKLVRDPEIQALAREPAFIEAARLMRDNPEAARVMVEHADAAKRALASPEMLQAMERNAAAAMAVERATEAARVLRADPQAQKILAEHKALDRYASFLVAMEKTAVLQQAENVDAARVFARNAEQAQKFAEQTAAMERAINMQALEKRAAESVALERYLKAHEAAARQASQYAEAAKALRANAEAAQLFAMDARMARLMMFDPAMAKVAAHSPAAMQAVLAYPQASMAMLAAPEASRSLLQNPESARLALQAEADRMAAARTR